MICFNDLNLNSLTLFSIRIVSLLLIMLSKLFMESREALISVKTKHNKAHQLLFSFSVEKFIKSNRFL